MTIIQTSSGVAVRLRGARVLAGLEQSDMASALGVARSTVSAWELGKTEPSASHFIRWARITGQTLEWLGDGVSDYGSEGWEFESLRARHEVDDAFWGIVSTLAVSA